MKLDGRVQHFTLVVQAAQGDDDVLPRGSLLQPAFQDDLHRAWDLPPEFAGGPDSGGVRSNDGRAKRSQRSVHVGMRVRPHDQGPGNDESVRHHDLVPDSRAGGIEPDSVCRGELADARVLVEIRVGPVLNVMVQHEHGLVGVRHGRCADGSELLHDRCGVVVRQHMARPDGHDISSSEGPGRPLHQVALSDPFDHCLAHLYLRCRRAGITGP